MARWTAGLDVLCPRAAEYPAQRAAELTGVPADEVTRAARMCAEASVAALVSGAPNGMGR